MYTDTRQCAQEKRRGERGGVEKRDKEMEIDQSVGSYLDVKTAKNKRGQKGKVFKVLDGTVRKSTTQLNTTECRREEYIKCWCSVA